MPMMYDDHKQSRGVDLIVTPDWASIRFFYLIEIFQILINFHVSVLVRFVDVGTESWLLESTDRKKCLNRPEM